MVENFYVSRKARLLRSFDQATGWVKPPLVDRYGQAFAQVVVDKARQEYERLLPHIPFIGGAKNRWTTDLLESAQILAFFRAMQACGKSSGESADLLYEGMRLRLARYPRFLLQWLGRLQFSRLFLNGLERQAAETRKHLYPDNFVATIVKGDGTQFDWGIDFTECAIHKFYKAQGALEFLPYLCQLDYLTSAAFGLGMVRTQTLAAGDDRCNPRLKHGRETEWN